MLKQDVVSHYKSERRAARELSMRGVLLTRQAVNQWPAVVPERTARHIAAVTRNRIPLRPMDYVERGNGAAK